MPLTIAAASSIRTPQKGIVGNFGIVYRYIGIEGGAHLLPLRLGQSCYLVEEFGL